MKKDERKVGSGWMVCVVDRHPQRTFMSQKMNSEKNGERERVAIVYVMKT